MRSKTITVDGRSVRVYSLDGKLWTSRPLDVYNFNRRMARDIRTAARQFNRIMAAEERESVVY